MDFSGFGNNKTFKAGGNPAQPYFYISATLPMAGAVSGGTYYFNADNSLAYAQDRDYSRFILVDDSLVISEVVVFADNEIVTTDDATINFLIGGANKLDPVEPYVKVPWAAPAGNPAAVPPGFSGGLVNQDDINLGTVNYFGHEGGHFPYFRDPGTFPPGPPVPPSTDLSKDYKYLAVTVDPANAPVFSALQAEQKRKRKEIVRALPSGEKVVDSGHLTVVLKVYPKSQ